MASENAQIPIVRGPQVWYWCCADMGPRTKSMVNTTTTMPGLTRRESPYFNGPAFQMTDSRFSGRTLASTVTMYRYENGRTYHAYRTLAMSIPASLDPNNLEQARENIGNQMTRSKIIMRPSCMLISTPCNNLS